MNDDMEYPIATLCITVSTRISEPDGAGGYKTVTVPDCKMFKVGDDKGPAMDGMRGTITKIEKRDHSMGAEFKVYVTNNGISRLWREPSSHEYDVVRNVKENVG